METDIKADTKKAAGRLLFYKPWPEETDWPATGGLARVLRALGTKEQVTTHMVGTRRSNRPHANKQRLLGSETRQLVTNDRLQKRH